MNKLLAQVLTLLLVLAPFAHVAQAFEDDLLSDEDMAAMEDDDLFGDDGADDISFGGSSSDDESAFPVAYANIDDMDVYDPYEFRERRGEYGYYISGAKTTNYFRVNENNEESTDETIGIIFFIVAVPAIIYNNVFGFWH